MYINHIVDNAICRETMTFRTGMDSNSNGSARMKTESGLALDQSSSSGRSTPTDLPHNKLFVGGLSWQTSADKLREYFGQYGTIIDVQVLKDPLTQVGNNNFVRVCVWAPSFIQN